MRKSQKYYIGEVKEQNGELEYETKYLFETDGCPLEYAERVTKTWRGDESNEYDEGAAGYWSGDCIMSTGIIKKIPLNDFNVLKKYLVKL